MFKIKSLFLFFCLLKLSSLLFAQEKKREVVFTDELTAFIHSYYNNEITSMIQAETFYANAVESVPDLFSEYEKEVHFARCDFFYGMCIIGDYDLSEIQQIKSMQDNNDYSKDTDISAKQKKLQAAHFFDSGIEHAKKALKLKTGTDAELIYTMCISSNCTVKNTAYLFANGLKVASIAKKAIKLDPKNAGAYYYQYAQDLYAPEFFANYKRGYQKMSEYFSDENLYFELFERFNFMTAIAYAFYKLGDMQNSIEWYKKALLIYPGNSNANQMITTISESLNKN